MSSSSSLVHPLNPELRSLYEISRLSQPQAHLEDYFTKVMGILSEYFSIGYSALVLSDFSRDSFYVGALFGIGKDTHPHHCSSRKGTISKVLQSRQPTVIHNLIQEPLYGEMMKGTQWTDKILPPLLCIPLIADDEPMGVININPLYGSRNDFNEDFQFLSTLAAILSPVIKKFHLTKSESLLKPFKLKTKTSPLDEILEEKLSEVLNKLDPYVESKTRLGIFDDIIAVVEKILITSALKRVDHVQVAAAKFLGINRNTLRKKIKELNIKPR
jgi:transcriptional regulator with GAF, ATPase, and Fis domain